MKPRETARLLVIASLAALSGAAIAQPTTYSYSGTPYVAPTGTFTTSMRITGSFTTANPLPKNMPPTAIGPAGSGAAIAWSFSNGIDIFTQANSSELYGNSAYFTVGTDNRGDIDYYSIALVTPIAFANPGDPADFLFIQTGNAVQALDQASCAIVTANVCTFIPFLGAGTVSESVESGAFLSRSVESVPVDSHWALGVLAALLALIGTRFARAGRAKAR